MIQTVCQKQSLLQHRIFFDEYRLVFTLNLEQLLSGEPLDTAIGVLQVTVHSARGITGVKIGGGTPDPYVSLSFNKRAELSKTSVKEDTYVYSTWYFLFFFLSNNDDVVW